MDVLTFLHPDFKASCCADAYDDLGYCWFEIPERLDAMNQGLDHLQDAQ